MKLRNDSSSQNRNHSSLKHLFYSTTLGVSLSAATLFFGPFARAESQRPNIVFFLLDDLDQVVTEPYYKDVLPQTMAIFENGFQYKNTFATTPLCCPARAAILSGCYGHNTGVYSNGGKYGGWEHFRDNEPTALPARLKNAGYRTFLGGKYLNAHHSDSPLPVGWTDGAVLSSPNLQKYRGYDYELLNWTGTQRWLERKGNRPEDYSTDVIKFKTLEFLNRAKNENDGQPFFALVAPTCPHLPLPPAPRHRNSAAQWGARTFPTQRANYYSDNGFEDKPSWLQDTLRKRHRLKSWGARVLKAMGGDLPPDTDRLDEMGFNEADWYNRMGSLLACDEMVAEVVNWLKKEGEWDNTIIVFTSDNGYNLGAHSLVMKITPYEESLRIPLFITGGKNSGILTNGRKVKDSWWISTDFAPTLLDLAGLPIPDDMDGESHASELEFLSPPNRVMRRNQFLIEYRSPGVAEGHLDDFEGLHYYLMPAMFLDVPPYDAIRTERWVIERGYPQKKEYLFVRWLPVLNQTQNEYELYDISEDPAQMTNLLYFAPDRYRKLAQNFEKELDELVHCKGNQRDRSCAAAELHTLMDEIF